MKMKTKKIMSMLLITTLSISATACGGDNSDSTAESDSTDNLTADGGYTDYSEGFEDTVTIQIPVYDRAYEGWDVKDNYYTNWVQEDFGDKYNINVEYVGISRTGEVNDYMQLLASGNAPDIIFHYDMPQMLTYYDEGAIQPLDYSEIEYYAPTYWGNMQETLGTYGAIDSTDYLFFGDRPNSDNYLKLIRKDWLDQVGMDIPTNLEELDAVLEAWADAGLGNGGGNLIQNSFTYDYAYRDTDMSEEDWVLYSDLSVASFPSSATYDYLKEENYRYNNNLIDTEFYLNTDATSTQADFVSGNSGIFGFYITNNTPVIDSLKQNNPGAEVAYLPTSASYLEGQTPVTRAYWPFGLIMGINHSSTAEERAAIWMYMDWLSQPENLFKFQNGVEGETYTLNEDGLAVKIPDYTGEYKLSDNNNGDYWSLVTTSVTYDTPELTKKANMLNWAPLGYEDIVTEMMDDFDYVIQYATPDPLFGQVIKSVGKYKSQLNEKWKELYVACVIASEADFDDVYNDSVQTFLDAGYQEILDEKQAAFDAGLYQ